MKTKEQQVSDIAFNLALDEVLSNNQPRSSAELAAELVWFHKAFVLAINEE